MCILAFCANHKMSLKYKFSERPRRNRSGHQLPANRLRKCDTSFTHPQSNVFRFEPVANHTASSNESSKHSSTSGCNHFYSATKYIFKHSIP